MKPIQTRPTRVDLPIISSSTFLSIVNARSRLTIRCCDNVSACTPRTARRTWGPFPRTPPARRGINARLSGEGCMGFLLSLAISLRNRPTALPCLSASFPPPRTSHTRHSRSPKRHGEALIFQRNHQPCRPRRMTLSRPTQFRMWKPSIHRFSLRQVVSHKDAKQLLPKKEYTH